MRREKRVLWSKGEALRMKPCEAGHMRREKSGLLRRGSAQTVKNPKTRTETK